MEPVRNTRLPPVWTKRNSTPYPQSVLHWDIIPWDLESNIWRINAYKISTSYIRKERRAKITETRRNGDWMALKGHWMVTEMYLPFSRLNGDWKVTEWGLSVFTEWWRFVLWEINLHSKCTGITCYSEALL